MLVVASALNSEPYEQATSTSQIGFTVELFRLVGVRLIDQDQRPLMEQAAA